MPLSDGDLEQAPDNQVWPYTGSSLPLFFCLSFFSLLSIFFLLFCWHLRGGWVSSDQVNCYHYRRRNGMSSFLPSKRWVSRKLHSLNPTNLSTKLGVLIWVKHVIEITPNSKELHGNELGDGELKREEAALKQDLERAGMGRMEPPCGGPTAEV